MVKLPAPVIDDIAAVRLAFCARQNLPSVQQQLYSSSIVDSWRAPFERKGAKGPLAGVRTNRQVSPFTSLQSRLNLERRNDNATA
jgi:hypothetical protein